MAPSPSNCNILHNYCASPCKHDPSAPSSDKPCKCPGSHDPNLNNGRGGQLPDYYVGCGVQAVPTTYPTCNKIVVGKDGKKECCTDCEPPKNYTLALGLGLGLGGGLLLVGFCIWYYYRYKRGIKMSAPKQRATPPKATAPKSAPTQRATASKSAPTQRATV